MSRDARYDILFEPVNIGPVTAPNRFYQVPHCTGMGYRYPRSEARLRGMKAEGGWGVVSTQEVEIHGSSDLSPYNEGRLWDESDIPALRLVTDAIHEHGSLAAIQLVHNGLHCSNRYTRELPMAPSSCMVDVDDPVQARGMSTADIQQFRQWHRDAAVRAKQAGFDIIYVYAGHDMTLLQHFLLRRHNHRSDEYGGSLENRMRLFREVIEDTREAVGNDCALAVRLAVDELMGSEGIEHQREGRDIIEALADLPDLWDVNLSDWSNDSQSSRFAEEGYQEPYTAFVKSVTSKPVVGVGRYTSPDTMVRLINSGHLDFIGAARPSIADPFLPAKIREGRQDDIRECIGCNICITGDNTSVPMRCTQNPTIGEEWRRGWHPELIDSLDTAEQFLVVGGGPAGLEAARALTQRGADVTIAERSGQWGGRVTQESRMPGLASWARVRDWRVGQLRQMPNARMVLHSQVSAQDILDYGIGNVVLATGSNWRADGVGRAHRLPLPFLNSDKVLTPDDLLTHGADAIENDGPVVIFDDDRFYMGSVLAELIVKAGFDITLVTPAAVISPWSENTLEQARIQARLIELGIKLLPLHELAGFDDRSVRTRCVYSSRITTINCTTLVSVTSRIPNDALWHDLQRQQSVWQEAGVRNVTRIGDCLAPGLIATACQSGHAFARAAGTAGSKSIAVRREDAAELKSHQL